MTPATEALRVAIDWLATNPNRPPVFRETVHDEGHAQADAIEAGEQNHLLEEAL